MKPKNLTYATIALLLLAACSGATKPTIKLSTSSPAVEDGETITLFADAKGGQGALRVEFYKGAEKVGQDSSAPYELKLPISSSDDVTLQFSAKVIASDNQIAVSEVVGVSVKVDKEAPKVSLAASSNNLNAEGAVTLNANASDNKGVVKVEFYKGSEKLGEDTTPEGGFSLVVNLSATNNGSLKYSAKAYDKKGNVGTSAEVGVVVDIDVTNPTITLSTNKPKVTLAGSATLTANASDNKGISRVEFFEGANELGEDTEAPFNWSISYTASNNGLHTYSAKAFDANGNSAASGAVNVSVDIDATLPTVNLSTDKPTLTQAGAATLTASATDDKGIVKVEFYKGTNKLGEDTAVPYTQALSFSAANNGTHTYTAKVTDTSGNIAASEPLSILVDIDITAPTVSLSADPTSLGAIGTITLSATALDNKGVSKVEFYKGDALIGTDSNGSDGYKQSLDYTSNYQGYDNFKAKAFDAAGNSASSNAVEVEINIDLTPPTVALSSDSSEVYGSTTLHATPNDASGIARVEFYIDGNPTPIASDSDGADGYTYTLSTTNSGIHSYTAKAYDNKGHSALSEAVSINMFTFTQISAGEHHTCAVGSNGKAYCWGDDTDGRLGQGSTATSKVPVAVSAGAVPAGVSLIQVTAGGSHTCALGSNGKAYCWGNGGNSNLGNNSTASSSVPVAVDISGVLNGVTLTQVSTSYNHTCALGSNGKAYCWGWGGSGRLGNGSTSDSSVPVAVSAGAIPAGVSLTQLAVGQHHVCALGSDQKVYCWGSGTSGALGYNSTSESSVPVAVDTSGVISEVALSQVASGTNYSCALGSDGNAYCWGDNFVGQLGNNSTAENKVPVAVYTSGVLSGINLSQISTGYAHTCALDSSRKAYCWGYGEVGQLGQNNNAESKVPVVVSAGEVPIGVGFTQMDLGAYHTCAVASDGRAYCWGAGYNGQVGNNIFDWALVPALVLSPQ